MRNSIDLISHFSDLSSSGQGDHPKKANRRRETPETVAVVSVLDGPSCNQEEAFSSGSYDEHGGKGILGGYLYEATSRITKEHFSSNFMCASDFYQNYVFSKDDLAS